MRIAFIGIGALGSYFGGRLAKAGNDVIFLARGAMLAVLRRERLAHRKSAGRFCAARGPSDQRSRSSGARGRRLRYHQSLAGDGSSAADSRHSWAGNCGCPLAKRRRGLRPTDGCARFRACAGRIVSYLGHGYRARRRPACWVQSRDHPRGAEQCTYTTAGEIGRMPHYRRTTDAGTR